MTDFNDIHGHPLQPSDILLNFGESAGDNDLNLANNDISRPTDGSLLGRERVLETLGLFGRQNAVVDDFKDSLSDGTASFGSLPIGTSATGRIETVGDKDLFSVSLVAGETYTFNLSSAATGGTGDPLLRILDGQGRQLAINDDFDGSLNSQLTFTATKSGVFYVEARDYSFANTGNYILTAKGNGGPTPIPDDFRDSLTDTTAPFGTLSVGGSTSGKVEAGGDKDLFSVTLTAGETYTFDLKGQSTGGLADPLLKLLDASGVQIASNNDAGGTRDSSITFTATKSGTFYLEAAGATASQTGGYSVSATKNTPSVPTDGDFDIDINFTGDARYETVFEQAASIWQEVIIGDIPDFSSARLGMIDDLLIDAIAVSIDGRGGVLASAGPDLTRSGSFLPGHGTMRFDTADLQALEQNGTLVDVIVHEMGHVLGIGTLWSQKGLKSGETSYIGENALDEYRLLVNNPNATFVPLETTGGPGTRGGHWAENVFGSELMTGFVSGGMQMSRMTIASLEDLGYLVNYDAAEPFSLPNRQSIQASDADLLIA